MTKSVLQLATAAALTLVLGLPSRAAAAQGVTTRIVPEPEATRCPAWKEDNLVLVVQRGTEVIDRLPFCSANGLATATVVTDAKGTPFVLLRHGIGRDSVVTRDYLTIYQAVQPLIEMFHVPVAATVGPESGWEYTYEIGKPAAGGLALDLALHVTGEDTGWAPAEKTRRFRLGVD
jgi:hypothetical protein